ncbi:unnamed protein product [Chrysoparadoxa australica]
MFRTVAVACAALALSVEAFVNVGTPLVGHRAHLCSAQGPCKLGASRGAPLFMSEEAAELDVLADLADLEELDSVLGDDRETNEEPGQPYLNHLAMQAAKRRWQRHEKDCGSGEVQVAIQTERIIYLTKHLQTHPKDFHSRRGLIRLVNNRRGQLNYLYKEDANRCMEMCQTLGIRFRPRSATPTREQKYQQFKNTKSKIGTLRAAAVQTELTKSIEAAAQETAN